MEEGAVEILAQDLKAVILPSHGLTLREFTGKEFKGLQSITGVG